MGGAYGRYWHLPMGLANLGNAVSCFCASYYPEPPPHSLFLSNDGGPPDIYWESYRLLPFLPSAWWTYYRSLANKVHEKKPQLVLAASDAFQLILGARLARRTRLPLVMDFYDDYEAYAATSVPGVRAALTRAVRDANLITCVSPHLRQKIERKYKPRCPVVILENGVSPEIYRETLKGSGLEVEGLPETAKVIGTVGGLSKLRGVNVLLDAFEYLSEDYPDLHLLLAGGLEVKLPDHPRIHYIGKLPFRQMRAVYDRLDVGVVCLKDNDFGRSCFPQKVAEYAATKTPMVFPSIGILSTQLADNWGVRVQPNNPVAMAEGILRQLDSPKCSDWMPYTWDELAGILNDMLDLHIRR